MTAKAWHNILAEALLHLSRVGRLCDFTIWPVGISWLTGSFYSVKIPSPVLFCSSAAWTVILKLVCLCSHSHLSYRITVCAWYCAIVLSAPACLIHTSVLCGEHFLIPILFSFSLSWQELHVHLILFLTDLDNETQINFDSLKQTFEECCLIPLCGLLEAYW